MTEILPERAIELSNEAKALYSDTLPYHNWTHATTVMLNAGFIARLAEGRLNPNLLRVAAAWHDAGYYEDRPGDERSKEQYSADLVREHIGGKLSAQDIDLIRAAIIDTTVSDELPDRTLPEGIALHYADVGYLASDPGKFRKQLGMMFREWRQRGGGVIDMPDALDRTRVFGAAVVDEANRELVRICPPRVVEGWTNAVLRNMEQLQVGDFRL